MFFSVLEYMHGVLVKSTFHACMGVWRSLDTGGPRTHVLAVLFWNSAARAGLPIPGNIVNISVDDLFREKSCLKSCLKSMLSDYRVLGLEV